MFQTLERVDAALSKVEQTLPPTARITTNRLTFATFPILGYSLTSKTIPQTRLWEIATYDLKPPLNRLAGVSTVTVQGGQVPEFHVIPDLTELQATSVTIPDIVNAIQATNLVDSPGLYESNHQLVLGLVGSQVHNIQQLARIVVKTTAAGVPVKLGDIAEVVPGDDACLHDCDGERPASGAPEHCAAAFGEYGRSSRRSRSKDCRAEQDAASWCEAGAVLRPVSPGAREHCQRSRCDFDWDRAGFDCAGGVSARLVVFAGGWPGNSCTILITFLFLKITGQSFNLMTLGGLAAAVGLVIDDAIVVVENIVLHRDSGETRAVAVRKRCTKLRVRWSARRLRRLLFFFRLSQSPG